MGKKKSKHYNHIPDKWLDYLPIGDVIENTRFIAFKVPLNNKYDKAITDPINRFHLEDLINYLKDNGKQLGMIIDLSYSFRYYNPRLLPSTIRHVKIMLKGRGKIPYIEDVLRFNSEVNRFLQFNRDNNKLIGVHCTHGLNRTGYMICRYMIEVCGIDPAAAIEMFSDARKHKIERPTYILDLMKRKHLNIRPPIMMNTYSDNSTVIKVNAVDNLPYVRVKAVSTCVKIETVKEDTPTCVKIETVKEDTPTCVKIETVKEDTPTCVKIETVKEDTPTCVKIETVKEDTPTCVKIETVKEDILLA
ncbi:SWPV2-ORF080 [Shearwaterpox virus]|uniref:SWPV2-ORF080 n=1 Tax=Shearwaterpox virus TaxID=1974596 RepID=A0A1V0QG44_CNPV|nr:SWPV2-ORF080 [Shearwaterpox virus]